MGAHSGSSSDDLIIMLGLGNPQFMTFLSYNIEIPSHINLIFQSIFIIID